MKVHVFTEERWNDDGSIELLEDRSFEYVGRVDLCGGNKSAGAAGVKQAGQTQQQVANTDIANQATADTGFNSALSTINNPTSSSLFSTDYATGLEDTANTYGNLKQQAYNLLGATGFGNSPSGQETSMINTLGNEEAQAQTGDYRSAINQAEGQGAEEAGLESQQEQIYNPNAPLSGASTSFSNLSKIPSEAGEIAGGIVDAASIGAAPFTGGASLVGMGLGDQLMGGGGGGNMGGFAQLFQSGGGAGAITDPNASMIGDPSSSMLFGSGGTPSLANTGTPGGSLPINSQTIQGFQSLFGPQPQSQANSYSPISSTKNNPTLQPGA